MAEHMARHFATNMLKIVKICNTFATLFKKRNIISHSDATYCCSVATYYCSIAT